MRRVIAWSMLLIALLPGVAGACQIVPWRYQALAEQADAAVIGKVISIGNQGRSARLAVELYVADQRVPAEIEVGPTVDSSRPGWDCPDTSVTFTKDALYVVLLRPDGSGYALAEPTGQTAFLIDANSQIQLAADSDQRLSAIIALRLVAYGRDLEIREPWRLRNHVNIFTVLDLLGAAGILVWVLIRRRRGLPI